MKRLIALVLSCALLLTACSSYESIRESSQSGEITFTDESDDDAKDINDVTEFSEESSGITTTEVTDEPDQEEIAAYVEAQNFRGLDDPDLLQYVEEAVYTGLQDEFQTEDLIIENINTSYLSKTYLETLAYNSKSNIWFGFTLDEIQTIFGDSDFVFTLGDNGETVVTAFEPYDDTYDKTIRNVAIGTGVILVCVTFALITQGAGLTTVSVIFTASAKTATKFALRAGIISAVMKAISTGLETGDMEKALKEAALAGSEGFMWGAIVGAIVGGANAAIDIFQPKTTTVGADGGSLGWKGAEDRGLTRYGGDTQLAYLDGKEVNKYTSGSTRPDIVRFIDGHGEAIEIKYYDLENPSSLSTLKRELIREISARVQHLPAGFTQRIDLDVTDRYFSAATVSRVIELIHVWLADIYPNIPIDVVGAVVGANVISILVFVRKRSGYSAPLSLGRW